MPQRRRRLLACLVVTTLSLTSCGGDDDDGGGAAGTSVPTSAPTAPGSTAPTSTDPPSKDPAKAAKAKAAILQLADFPAGWKEDPESTLDLEATWRDLTRCLGVATTEQSLGIAVGVTFLRGLATQARSTVEYMPEPSAGALAAALAGPRFQGCATEAFTADVKRAAPEGAVPGPLEVAKLDFPKLGQTTSATRVKVTLDMQGLAVPITQDLIVVFDGDTVSRMVFLNPGDPFPPDLQRSLVERVVGRA